MLPRDVSRRLGWLAANIRRRRIKQNKTQADFAEIVGLTPRYIATLETGTANPTATVLLQIADGLGMTLGELFRETTTPAKRGRGRPRKSTNSR
jgi:transcriptional regulator with XRE-family HTH domain